MAQKKFKFGIIGLGFGEFHLKTLIHMEDVCIVGLADRNLAKTSELAEKYQTRAYSDGAEMIRTENPDAVVLSTNPQRREEIIDELAERNIATFVEKPWASNEQQAKQLQLLAKKNNAPIMVGFSFRFLPTILKAKSLLQEFGDTPWLANGEYVFDWLPPAESWLWKKDGGNGFFNENSCHLFDCLQFLLGEPESVYAKGIIKNGRASSEAAALTVSFQNGAIASIALGGIGVSAFSDFPRLDIISEKHTLKLRGNDHIWTKCEWAERGKNTIHTFTHIPEKLGNTRYTYAMQHFLSCVKTGNQPEATIHDGVNSVKFAMAVNQSILENKEVKVHEK